MDGLGKPSLDKLVFDYLYHAGYVGSARAFMTDTRSIASTSRVSDNGVDGEIDVCECNDGLLASMKYRNEVMNAILNGRIAEALELLRKYFPSVLDETRIPHPNPPKVPSQSSNPLDAPTPTGAGTPKTKANESSLTRLGAYPPFLDAHTTSTNPLHLALNLRIHAFIESFRTEPLPYPPGTSASSNGTLMGIDRPSKTAISEVTTAAAAFKLSPQPQPQPQPHSSQEAQAHPTSLDSLSDSAEAAKQESLLKDAHRLWNEVNSLEDESDRKAYQAEMINVASLLAYQKPETSPVAPYLSQRRRQAVADQVQNAILYNEKLPPRSKIEECVRQIHLVFRRLNEMGVVLPRSAERPRDLFVGHSLVIPGEKDSTERVTPLFNLHDFLKMDAFGA